MNEFARLANHRRVREHRKPMPRRLPGMVLLTDRDRQADPRRLVAALRPGDWVIVRDYDHPDRAAYAAAVVRICRARRVRCLIAGDAKLAFRLRADGVHLPRWHSAPARRDGLCSLSFHGLGETRRARRISPDLILCSPVFPTRSHPGARPLGPLGFHRATMRLSTAVAALGGVNGRTLRRLKGVVPAFVEPENLRSASILKKE